MEACTQVEIKKEGRDNKGRFNKGVSGNPSGKNGLRELAGLIEALENESKKQGYKNFDEVVSQRALQHETVLIAVMKKVYPEQSGQPIVNIYTSIWNGALAKSERVDQSGRLISA